MNRKNLMVKCKVCEELIGPTAVSYKASSGFLDKDGVFHEDITIFLHRECHNDYVYSPFAAIEKSMKDGEL